MEGNPTILRSNEGNLQLLPHALKLLLVKFDQALIHLLARDMSMLVPSNIVQTI